LRLFVWCLVSARWRDSKDIKRGQFDTGRSQAAEQLNVHPSKWYRGIVRLRELGCITFESNSLRTRITVCNYSTYNDSSDETEQIANSERTASEQLPLEKEERKKERTAATSEKPKPEPDTPCLGQDESSGERKHDPANLATEWVFYRKGNKGRIELDSARETFGEMIRLGCPGAEIAAEIKNTSRRMTEPLWDFENRLMRRFGLMGNAKQNGKATVSEGVIGAFDWARKKVQNEST
jgi:hypothetical protein